MVSRYVADVIQIAVFVVGLVGTLLFYAHYGRWVRALWTALLMGILGLFAVVIRMVPQGPGIPILLSLVGFIAAALAPRYSNIGSMTERRLRAIGYLLYGLCILVELVLGLLGIKIV